MYPYVEAIKLRDGEFYRLPYHQERVNRTFATYFPETVPVVLEQLLANAGFPSEGIFKVRVEYNPEVRVLETVPYVCREIRSLQLIETALESSFYKSSERSVLANAFACRGNADDVLLVRNGFLTDTSYCNIALFDGTAWFTPRLPVLYGTNRSYLLENGLIRERDIAVSELKNYSTIALFNAMVELGELVLPVEKVAGFLR